jgi:pimeloyl-ACP methyl ester carboxylesterase
MSLGRAALVVLALLLGGCGGGAPSVSPSIAAWSPSAAAPATAIPSPTPRTAPATAPTPAIAAGSTEIPTTTLPSDFAFLGPIHMVPVGELSMAYRQFGSGPELLMIAGQASPMSIWPASTLAALADHFHVTIYDNRDLGNTTDTSEPFALTDLADDAAGLITALGLDRPAVFGWSMGGEIGLLLAVRHPDALSALAITGATPGGPHSVLPSPELQECQVTLECDLLAMLFTATPAGTEARARFIDSFQMVPQEPLVPGTERKYDQTERAFWSGEEPDLDAITVPVLVMNGEADPAAPSANATYIAERIGDNARLEIDHGTRHGWFIEHPDRFLELMTDFLD